MKKLLNGVFSFFKYLLLIVAFGATLFVTLKLYVRLEKNLMDAVPIFLPYLLLLLLFVVSFCANRKYIRENIFYNITCCLAFVTNIVVVYRAVFDKNMLFNTIQKQGVNFNYFNDYLAFNRIMFYGLFAAGLIFMLVPNENKSKKKDKVVEKIKITEEKVPKVEVHEEPEIKKVETPEVKEKEEVVIKKIDIDDEIL